MKTLNRFSLLGRVGHDPEARESKGPALVVTVSLATDTRQKGPDGQWGEGEPDWHRVTFFGRLAEVVREHVGKGDALLVEGRIEQRRADTAEGVRTYTNLVANELHLLGSGGGRQRGPTSGPYQGQGSTDTPVAEPKPQPVSDPDDALPY